MGLHANDTTAGYGLSPAQVASPVPEVRFIGPTASLSPADVVIEEQRSVLHRLGLPGRHHGPHARGEIVSGADRLRLVQLVLALLAQAATTAEAECLGILTVAEQRAAAIVRQAHDDVAQLMDCLGPAPVLEPPPVPGGLADLEPAPTRPQARQGSGDWGAVQRDIESSVDCTSVYDDLEADFFASFGADEEERWRFLDEGELVGAAPALVRKLLCRPTRPRDQSTDE